MHKVTQGCQSVLEISWIQQESFGMHQLDFAVATSLFIAERFCIFVVVDSKETTEISKQSSLSAKDYESRAPFKHCPLCSFRTKRDSHLQKHVQLHDRNIPLLHCAQCSFSTTRQNHLTRHEMQHKSTVYHCDHAGCKYRTDNRRLLRRHATLRHCMNNRTSEHQSLMRPALECPMMNCTYKTHRAHLIRRHLSRHAAVDAEGALVEQYSCSACAYETKKREHYLRHINVVHSDVRLYLCDNCGQSFKRKDSLVQHSIVHLEKSSRIYQFECQTCHTKFRSQVCLPIMFVSSVFDL